MSGLAIYTVIDGVLAEHATLSAAVTAIGSTRCTVVVRDDVTMAASATFPSTATLRIENRAQITTTGFTLTINGGFSGDPVTSFAGSGTVAFGSSAWYVGGVRTAAEVLAAVTPSNYMFQELDIRRYGAIADDTTVCDTAVQSAIKVAACYAPGSFYQAVAAAVYVPPGTFLLTGDNPLGSVDFTTLSGAYDTRYYMGFRGDGQASRLHWKPTGSAARWLYDNGASSSANNRLVLPLIEGLQIVMDPTGLSAGGTVNGFRCYGDTSGVNGVTQGLRFFKARFVGAEYPASATDIAKTGTLIKLLGTVNCSETVMVGCSVRGLMTLLDIGTNPEAVNHTFVATDCEAMYGDVIKWAGGSSINWYGGSVTMMSEGASQAYFLAARLGSATLAGACHFSGIRVELNKNGSGGDYSNLVLLDATNQATAYTDSFATISFDACNFYPISRSSGDTLNIDSATRMVVNFTGCDGFDRPLHNLRMFSSKTNLRTANGTTGTHVNFANGTAPAFTRVSFVDAHSIGMVSAARCRNVLDYDLGVSGKFHVTDGRSVAEKTALIYGSAWPDAGNNSTMQLTLPPRSVLIDAGFRKAANGGTATAGYQLAMVDGASNILPGCSSTIANQNVEHKGQLTAGTRLYMDDTSGYVSGISFPQTVYLIATATHTGSAQAVAMAATDFAYLKYI